MQNRKIRKAIQKKRKGMSTSKKKKRGENSKKRIAKEREVVTQGSENERRAIRGVVRGNGGRTGHNRSISQWRIQILHIYNKGLRVAAGIANTCGRFIHNSSIQPRCRLEKLDCLGVKVSVG